MLIVSETYGGRSHLVYELYILLMVFGKQRVAETPAVLMTGYAAERILSAVEDKASFRVNFKGAAAEPCAYIVEHFAVLRKLHLSGVEIRVFSAVPQMDIINID